MHLFFPVFIPSFRHTDTLPPASKSAPLLTPLRFSKATPKGRVSQQAGALHQHRPRTRAPDARLAEPDLIDEAWRLARRRDAMLRSSHSAMAPTGSAAVAPLRMGAVVYAEAAGNAAPRLCDVTVCGGAQVTGGGKCFSPWGSPLSIASFPGLHGPGCGNDLRTRR